MDLQNKSHDELVKIAEALHVLSEKKKYKKLEFMFPDGGPLRRELYKKHMLFFKAGALYKERAMIAGNRTGKSFTAAYEMALHLTGRYPHWWEGKRFNHPIQAWAVGKTHETTRDILQRYLMGPIFDLGTGMVPKEDIIHKSSKPGTPDAIQDVHIRHYTNGTQDGISEISFKSYVQGVEAFMGTQRHVIHLDEEPDHPSIYSECLTRTMTTQGIVLCTFTPLQGLSDTVLSFLPNGKFPPGGIGTVESQV